MYNSKCRDLKNFGFMKSLISGTVFSESTSRLELTALWFNFSNVWCLSKLLALQINLMKKIAGCHISLHMKCGLVMKERGFYYMWN